MNEHTPAPWQVTEDPRGEIVRAADSSGRPIASMWMNGDDMKGNAAFIVKAVNSHDELVKLASKLAREVLGSFELFEPLARQQMGNTNYRIIVDDAEAVLASIKEFGR